MRPTYVSIAAAVLAILIPVMVKAQSPDIPSKSPGLPSKTQPLASPQQALASPQQTYEAPVQAQVVVQAVPRLYAVQRQVVVQAAPVTYATLPYTLPDDVSCVGQQAVVERSFVQHSAVVNHGVVHSAQINHGVVAAAGRQPKKVITKQVTKVKRGLFGK